MAAKLTYSYFDVGDNSLILCCRSGKWYFVTQLGSYTGDGETQTAIFDRIERISGKRPRRISGMQSLTTPPTPKQLASLASYTSH